MQRRGRLGKLRGFPSGGLYVRDLALINKSSRFFDQMEKFFGNSAFARRISEMWAWMERRFARYLKFLLPIEWVILGAAAVWVCLIGFYFPDIWWQLSEGGHFFETGQFPENPIGTFGVPAKPLSREYLAYEIFIALVCKVIPACK